MKAAPQLLHEDKNFLKRKNFLCLLVCTIFICTMIKKYISYLWSCTMCVIWSLPYLFIQCDLAYSSITFAVGS